jgi:polyisoprenoid-binding protein YceI
MPSIFGLLDASRRTPVRRRRASRSAKGGVFLATALFASAALAGPGVSSTKISDMPAGAYVSDQAHTSVSAKLLHLGFSNYTLRFDKVDAQFRFDPASPGTSRLVVSIDPASIDTGSKGFDAQLTGRDWFDAEDFPTITFVSDRIDLGDGQHGTVSGTLTLHGVAKPVILAVTFNGVGGDLIPFVTRAGFSANTTIKRSDFGLTRFPGLVGDDVQLVVEIEFTRKLL